MSGETPFGASWESAHPHTTGANNLEKDMTKKQAIIDALTVESYYTKGGTMITCPNHLRRRMFRCWLDGSYLGQAHYQRNCQRILEAGDHWGKLRSFVVEQFGEYIAHEFDCSRSTAVDAIKAAFPDEYADPIEVRGVTVFTELQHLTEELMEDARDLVAEVA